MSFEASLGVQKTVSNESVSTLIHPIENVSPAKWNQLLASRNAIFRYFRFQISIFFGVSGKEEGGIKGGRKVCILASTVHKSPLSILFCILISVWYIKRIPYFGAHQILWNTFKDISWSADDLTTQQPQSK